MALAWNLITLGATTRSIGVALLTNHLVSRSQVQGHAEENVVLGEIIQGSTW